MLFHQLNTNTHQNDVAHLGVHEWVQIWSYADKIMSFFFIFLTIKCKLVLTSVVIAAEISQIYKMENYILPEIRYFSLIIFAGDVG